jgi:hypothetical protein
MINIVSEALRSISLHVRGQQRTDGVRNSAVTIPANSQNAPINNQGGHSVPSNRRRFAASFVRFIRCGRTNGGRSDSASQTERQDAAPTVSARGSHKLRTSKHYRAAKKQAGDDAVKAYIKSHPKWLASLGLPNDSSTASASASTSGNVADMPAMPSDQRFLEIIGTLERGASPWVLPREGYFLHYVKNALAKDSPKIMDEATGEWRSMTKAEREIEAPKIAANASLSWLVDFYNSRCSQYSGYENEYHWNFVPMRYERVSDAKSLVRARADLEHVDKLVLGYTEISKDAPWGPDHSVIIKRTEGVFRAFDSTKDALSEPLDGETAADAVECFLTRHSRSMSAAGTSFEYAVYDLSHDPFGSISQYHYPPTSSISGQRPASGRTWEQCYDEAKGLPDSEAIKSFVVANPRWLASLGIKAQLPASSNASDLPGPRAPDGVRKAIQLAFVLGHLPHEEQKAEALAILEKMTSDLEKKLELTTTLRSRKELATNLVHSAHELEHTENLQKHAVRLARFQYDFLSKDEVKEISRKIYELPRLKNAVTWAYEQGISNDELACRFEVLQEVRRSWLAPEGSKSATVLNLSSALSKPGNLNSFIPDLHELLPNIETIDLTKSGFHVVPDEIYSFEKLTRLLLPPIDSLSEDIGRLQNLETLTIEDGHRLISLPNNMDQLKNLRVLSVGAGTLQSLPVNLSHLKNLIRIFVDDNVLESIPDGICSLPSLEILDLSHNKLRKLPSDFSALNKNCDCNLEKNLLDPAVRDSYYGTKNRF